MFHLLNINHFSCFVKLYVLLKRPNKIRLLKLVNYNIVDNIVNTGLMFKKLYTIFGKVVLYFFCLAKL